MNKKDSSTVLTVAVLFGVLLVLPTVVPSTPTPSGKAWGLIVSNTCWGYNYWGSYFGETQINIIKREGATAISLMLDKYAWELGSTSNVLGIPYKDYIKQLCEWCKPELTVWLQLQHDTRTGDDWATRNSATEGKGGVILNYNGQRDAWINWGKEVIAYCNPDGIGIMDEPRGGAGQITFDYYYENFLVPSIQAYKAVKPNILQLVQPFPFAALELFRDRPVSDPNVFYEFHLYLPQEYPYTTGHPHFENSVNAYHEGRLSDAKAWLHTYLDDFKFAGLPKTKIFWYAVGCMGMETWEPTQPNWQAYLNDCYAYTRQHNLKGIFQYAAGLLHYCIFDPQTSYTTFTPYGEVWAENMKNIG